MRKYANILLAGAGAMTLAACGAADDASIDAEADTVEMPADAALEGVMDAPVEDAEASADDTAEENSNEVEDTASDIADAAEEARDTADAVSDAVDRVEAAVE